ncbi:hypothetical protein BS47DRAFT_1445811, partial [Hydnum rufescens UP504]
EEGTRTVYGAGIIWWAEWCEANKISEDCHLPADPDLLLCFITDSAGCMGTSTVENWLAGLWAWHTFHNFPFPGDTPTIQAAIVAVGKLAPISSKRMPRPPVMLEHLHVIRDKMDFSNSFDTAFWAVICVAFWGIARLGEVTVPSVNHFILGRHVHKDTAVLWSTHGNAQSVSIHIPWTKTTQRTGATLILTHKDDCTCPFHAVQQQLLTNAALPSDTHFFGFLTSDGWQPMVKRSVITRCNEIWARYSLQGPSGHSFRIGGTTHHLTRGTDLKLSNNWVGGPQTHSTYTGITCKQSSHFMSTTQPAEPTSSTRLMPSYSMQAQK